ncbi:MAG: ATP-binding protein [Candidatus Marinimicrobia bacterium]|nr:ATP-binding protein [Candidatus Neomarinimicrobiota bacterium]
MDRSWIPPLTAIMASHRQITILSGPRQVGKTTMAKHLLNTFSNAHENAGDSLHYLNWDDVNHRDLILRGPDQIISELELDQLFSHKPLLVLDEIHKYTDWKNFLKGFFDRFEDKIQFMVTGSARMDLYSHGSDSLMGRTFNYRLHPLSVREIIGKIDQNELLQGPSQIASQDLQALIEFGGFPEPFLKRDKRFSNRWQNLRLQQLIREDIRDATRIHEIQQLEVLQNHLRNQVGQETKYSTLARHIRVSVDTIRRWLDILESFYFCFRIRPWHRNIATALRKEPKTYLWDWALIRDPGARSENFIASHLLKATHWWTDQGLGQFELFYLRTKEGREVDFLVTKDEDPWFLVEVKQSPNSNMNPNLHWFQKKTAAPHAFQVELSAPYVDADCFQHSDPIRVPAQTFLSQLV